jgi:hypothetical protein
MKKLLLFLSLTCVNLSITAVEIGELFDAAIEADSQTSILTLSLANKRLQIERAGLKDGLHVSLNLGGLTASHDFEPAPGTTSVSASPSVSINLGHPYETDLSLSLPLSFSFGQAPPPSSLSPLLSVSQPLSLGEEDPIGDLEDLTALRQAEVNLKKRSITVRRSLLSSLKALIALERSLVVNQRSIDSALKAVEKERALGIDLESSISFIDITQSLDQLRRKRGLLEQEQQMLWEDLEQDTGRKIDTLPESIPGVSLVGLTDIQEQTHPAVYFALLDERIAALKLAEERGSARPDFSVDGSYQLKTTDFTVDDHIVSGTFNAGFEDVSVSASLQGSIPGKSLSLTVGLTWSQPDTRAKALTIREKENNLEIARISLERARRDLRRTVRQLEFDIIELNERSLKLEESRRVAQLRLAESQTWFEQEIIGEEELEQSQWNSAKLEFDERLLALDILLAGFDIESLTLLEE